jgi:hypothetical protein
MHKPRHTTRHTVLHVSAVATITGIAVLIAALLAVSHINDDVSPATILRCAVGFLVLVATIGCSAAVWAICCAFDSVTKILSGVAASKFLGDSPPEHLRVLEGGRGAHGT